jgi:hypothetical protein
MGCFSRYFEFYANESKRLELQVNVDKNDCKEPIGMVVPLASASLIVQDLTYTALLKRGDTGNLIAIEYVGGGTAGSEVVTLSGTLVHVGQGVHIGSKITVQIEAGVSTATQIKAKIDANADIAKLLTVAVSGVGSNAQIVAALQSLSGGTGTQVEIELPASPDNLFVDQGTSPQVVIDDAPLSKIHVDLTSVETSQMVDGAIIVRVTKQGKMSLAVVEGGSKKLTIPNC